MKGGTEWSKSKKKGEDYLENSNWISPVPLRTDKSALPDFPLTCLPLIPQAMAVGVAETTSTDISMSATALLSALSFCFSGVYRMFGKADHSEPLTLYSLILANPAERKSPVMRFVKSPFLSFAEDYNKWHRDEIYTSQEAYKKLEAEISEMQNKNERLIKVETSGLDELCRQVSGVSKNINQIVKRINSTNDIYADDVIVIKQELEKIWQLLKSTLSALL